MRRYKFPALIQWGESRVGLKEALPNACNIVPPGSLDDLPQLRHIET